MEHFADPRQRAQSRRGWEELLHDLAATGFGKYVLVLLLL
jgi:hypothetical protein